MTDDVPNPGSDAAIERGCTCPRMDNGRGMGIPLTEDSVVFWIDGDCPLHGSKRERSDG